MNFDLTSLAESLIKLYLNGTGSDPDQIVDIEAAIGDETFVSKDGYLMSVIKITGKMYEDNNYHTYKASLDAFVSKISEGLRKGEHALHFTYVKDVGREELVVEESLSLSREKARGYGFDGLDELFDDQVKHISKQILEEDVYVAVWTNTSFLNTKMKEDEKVDIDAAIKELPNAPDAHGLIDTYSRLKVKHRQYVQSVVDGLRLSSVKSEVLDRDFALLSISKIMYPFLTRDFKFIFPDRPYYPKPKEYSGGDENDASHLLWDSIPSQIIREDDIDVDLDDGIVQVGDRCFSTFEVKNPPRNLVTFNTLGDTIRMDVPVMISFVLSSTISFSFFWKKLLATLPVPASNKRIKKSIAAVDLLKEIGEPNIEYKVSVTTWADKQETLLEYRDYLKGAVSSWGSSVVRNFRGCPFDALASSIHGVNYKTFGSTVYAPLSGVVPQLPIGRRLRFWEHSSLNFVGSGDVIYPYMLRSSKQKYWNIGVSATMGAGKSVLLQSMVHAHIFGDTVGGEMPMVGYIDNGFSVKTYIETMTELAPPDKKHLFKHITYENSKKHTYNVFDTQLGCRFPDVDQMNQIISILTAVITPAGDAKVHGDVDPLLRRVVTDAYAFCSDSVTQKPYREGRADILDTALKKLKINTSGKTYYEIVDELFARKQIVVAEFAQRYAVPTLQDVIQQLTISNSIANAYKGIVGYNNEELVSYVKRVLTASIERYPVLAGVTQINVGLARFIVIDLDKVAKGGSVEADKDTTIFYSLARFIVSRSMFISKTLLDVVPDLYMAYHEKRVKLIKAIPKLLVYDEFHRLKGSAILIQIMREMREGRKWSLTNLFASQLLSDFKEDMQELLSSIFLMSNDVAKPEDMQKAFDLNDDTMGFVMRNLNGPNGKNGTSMVAKFKFKEGTLTQRLRFVLHPMMYWMTTSDSIDDWLKNAVISRIGIVPTIRALGATYGFGARDAYEHLSKKHADKSVRNDPLEFMVKNVLSAI